MGRGQTQIIAERNNAAKTGTLSLARSERYFSNRLPIKLAQLACNLKRVSALARANAISNTRLDVCRYLIEWSAPDLLPDRVDDAVYLVDV